jgi:hypothetical protein
MEAVLAYPVFQMPNVLYIGISFAAWTAVYLASLHGSGIVNAKYRTFSAKLRVDWSSRVVAFVHAVVVCYAATLELQANGVYLQQNTINHRSDTAELVCCIAIGYFLWDLCLCFIHLPVFGVQFVVHAVLSGSTYVLAMV